MNKIVDFSAKTILVTGATGFIGANLAKRLCEENPDAKIIGFDSINDYYDTHLKEYRLGQLSKLPNFEFVKGNLADKTVVNGLFEKYHPNIVVNLAAQAGVRYSIDHPDAYIESNLIGFYNILEACRHYQPEHLVYASSSSVYGGNKKMPLIPMDEGHFVCLFNPAAAQRVRMPSAHRHGAGYAFPSTPHPSMRRI